MRPHLAVLFLATLASFVSSPLRADDARGGGKEGEAKNLDFARDIRPILATRCWSCHGEKANEGGLRLHNRAAALAGGDSGKAMIPGKSAESRLIKYVTGKNDAGLRMPPELADRLVAIETECLLYSNCLVRTFMSRPSGTTSFGFLGSGFSQTPAFQVAAEGSD